MAAAQIVEDRADAGDEDANRRLLVLYGHFFKQGMTGEDVRRAFQLAVLKGMKQEEDKTEGMTADVVVLLAGHLASLLFGQRHALVVDPAVGTANLLTGVMNQLNSADGCGADNDEVAIALAFASANLQQREIHLLHQDGLRPLLVAPADLVVSEPPDGVYQDADVSAGYALHAVGQQADAPFLFIEQGLRILKFGGYLLYVIPNRLFAEDRDKVFYKYAAQHADILALLQLPQSLFQHAEAAKSIMLLQKKDGVGRPPKETLLAELPDFTNTAALGAAIRRIDRWFANTGLDE